MKNKIIYIVLGIVLTILFILLIYGNFFVAPYISNIEKNDSMTYEDMVIINVNVDSYFFKFDKSTWCLLSENNTKPDINDSNWILSVNGYCSFTKPSGNYYVFVKDRYGNVADVNNQIVKIDKVLNINTNKDKFYLYLNQESKIEYDLDIIGNADNSISFVSSNDNIVSVNNEGYIKANGVGSATIKLLSSTGTSKNVEVVVSKFITYPHIDTSKSYIDCNYFSDIDNDEIDSILADRVEDAGYQTRAGVVAAARFLTLEFNYRVHYFYENGRLNNYEPYFHVDGEGRYYHKGLYLSDKKIKSISAKLVGPAKWGCSLQNYTDWGPYITGEYYPNGLDCSGFVTWALLNGGFDVGDIGAGIDNDHFDLTNLGKRVPISDELMNSGRVKVGDLIGLDGHAAILAGWDDENYYIAESLNTTGGVVMTVVKKNNLVHNSIYKYIVLMDNYYKNDGNLSNIW